jgi:hypothetical protein
MVRLFSLDLSYAAFSSRMTFRISERFQLGSGGNASPVWEGYSV